MSYLSITFIFYSDILITKRKPGSEVNVFNLSVLINTKSGPKEYISINYQPGSKVNLDIAVEYDRHGGEVG